MMKSIVQESVNGNIRIALRTLVQSLIETFLPAHCILCGLRSKGCRLCGPCSEGLPRLEETCRQCAVPVMHSGPMLCGSCLRHPPAWDSAIAALCYEYPVDQLVRRYKFHRNFACGQLLADELAQAVQRRMLQNPKRLLPELQLPELLLPELLLPELLLPELLLPVPLHFTRRIQRGFNQAELLARSVGAALRIPVRVDCLHRKRRTAAQSGLDRAARRKNVNGAFTCRDLAGARIALVDDVLTTGTTLEVCARAARKAGASHIAIWVAARVPAPTAN